MESTSANNGVTSRRRELPDPARVRAARIRLLDAGQKVPAWARQHGENPELVQKVLSGRRACVSGASHRIAVKLGIKDGAPVPAIAHA